MSFTKLSLALGVGIGLIAPIFDIVVQTVAFFVHTGISVYLSGG